jgi:ubiquinone/menaquinone biosynthesis C-methylase UbiE
MSESEHRRSRASIVAEYARWAADYERRWSFYIEATTEQTLARLNLRARDRLLDVGCGTGVLLARLAREHPPAHLAGVDPVPEMLSIARRKLPASTELHEAWAERLPFGAEQFDVVVSCNVFHYIQEPIEALREIDRVLRPGGRLVITDWCDDYLACRLCGLYLRLFSRAHFKIYGAQDCARLLREVDYTQVAITRYKINWLWGLMTAIASKDAERP